MSIHQHPLSTARGSTAKSGLRGTKLLQVFARGIQRWQRNRARVALERLDDRQLADIGIARNDIPWTVEELFRERSVRTPSPSFRTGPSTQIRKAA